ncbi:MAG: alanine racemase [Lachnospiraceae bacterium]|nr:alanine racemase [Lachnospiraceae bacterium]
MSIDKKDLPGRVYAAVNLDILSENIRAIRSTAGERSKLIAVVKADAYGHGAGSIATWLERDSSVGGFAVATVEEALELRKYGVRKPIILLGYTFPDSYEAIVREELRPAVFKADQARGLSDEALRQGKRVKLHLAVDTGMSRIGVKPGKESLPLVQGIASLPNVEMEGVFTHFYRADETAEESVGVTGEQFRRFTDFISICEEGGVSFGYCHCANSAAIMVHPSTHMDMVRAGIILYGLSPSGEVGIERIGVRPILEMKSHIVYIKYIDPGTEVSYGGTYTAREVRRVATIPVGYGDGYPRSLSNKGWVLIHGKRSPIIGRICMDQFMVDVTDIPDVSEYDEVTLIGRDGKETLSMEMLGDLSGRFNYELACCFTNRVPRVYLSSSF